MKIVSLFLAFALIISSAMASVESPDLNYSKRVTVTFAREDGSREPYGTIRIVKVHPNVSIHYFKKDNDSHMHLQHALDSSGVMYYNAVLFPIIGIKTYVNDKETSGKVMPEYLLDDDSKEILDLTLLQINQFGGAEAYCKFLANRG